MPVSLVWITPDAERVIADMARVSNVANRGRDHVRLLSYMIRHGHWSPFEMASACFEIVTSRAVARQIIRHRSFSFQEFSQRYSIAEPVEEVLKARRQSAKNRQGGDVEFEEESSIARWWKSAQESVLTTTWRVYQEAVAAGIAREVARAVLPEGLTLSRLAMAGTIRSWIHFLAVRCAEDTQKETRTIARELLEILRGSVPNIMEAASEVYPSLKKMD